MKIAVLGIILASLFVSAQVVEAGDLTVRLVAASNNDSASSKELSDVIELLKKTLAFKSYSLKGSSSVALPAANKTISLGGYSVKCDGNQGKLEIVVKKSGKVLLSTKVSLKSGKPLILGGFPQGANKLVLIFVAH